MVFGYTILDPLVVIAGTSLAAFYLLKNPVRLVVWLPTFLTVYFFIPFFTYLTLWQTVPLLLALRVVYLAKLKVPSRGKPLLYLLIVAFAASTSYATLFGENSARTIVRFAYYVGLFALFSFAYEVGRDERSYEKLLKGLVVLGAVLAVYGLYQIVAGITGFPMRGIVRGTEGVQVAYEAGFMRINSFASEPKRLGYVLFVCALACVFYASYRPGKTKKLKLLGLFIGVSSLFTFAGSYFLSIFIFLICGGLLYPSRVGGYIVIVLAFMLGLAVIYPDLGIFDAIQAGYERRAAEIEIGLNGSVVYRQEFYAWDYLKENPFNAVFGLGIGQYFGALREVYGPGVGISEKGSILPLNSAFLDFSLDFGVLITLILYLSLTALILKLRKAGETYLCLALLFVVLQSTTLLTFHFVLLFAGFGIARLETRKYRSARYKTKTLHPERIKKNRRILL